LGRLGRRISSQTIEPGALPKPLPKPLLMFLFLALGFPARGESADAPIRLLIPYAETMDPRTLRDPLAFLPREDFIRLWNAANPQQPVAAGLKGFVSALEVEGGLHPERSMLTGRLSITGVNPDDDTTSLVLPLGPIQFSELKSDPSGATLESIGNQYVLWMPPHWAGRLDARFEAPCKTNGLEGNWRIEWPETASGSWKIHFPYPDILPQTTSSCVVESKTPTRCTVSGPIRRGTLDLGWKASATARDSAQAATASARPEMHAEIKMEWNTPAYAEWSAVLRLVAPAEVASLPGSVRFSLDPRLELTGAEGSLLRAASLEGRTLELRLDAGRSTELQLHGVVLTDLQSPSGDLALEFRSNWSVPGIRALEAGFRSYSLRLNFASSIELLSIHPRGLEQKSPGETAAHYSTRFFESIAADWSLNLELRRLLPVFKAELSHLVYPTEGLLRQAGVIVLSPEGLLSECIVRLPPNTRMLTLSGPSLVGWAQYRDEVRMAFHPPLLQATVIEFTADADFQSNSAGFSIASLDIPGASEIRRKLAIARDPDVNLQEVDLAGATLRLPVEADRNLLGKITDEKTAAELELRGYQPQSAAPLVFQWVPIKGTSLNTVYNLVTLSNGLQTLESIVHVVPRQGRIREIELLMLPGQPDVTMLSRLQPHPSVAHFRTEILSETLVRLVAELREPLSQSATLSFSLTQPVATDGKELIRPTLLLPTTGGGERAFLLLRRALDGELSPVRLHGAQPADPAAISLPDINFRLLPSELFYELNPEERTAPVFALARHAQGDVLRAVVEVLRQRTIYTEDGLQRNELEMVLQNQSEQFLRIALPYAKSLITIYDIQVAGRSVKPIFSEEDGQEALFIPLNRTGLLEPELTVRVVYLVKEPRGWDHRGEKHHVMPRVLGGVPIAQSALVLMLPESYQYSDFDGSLNPVHMVDLEVDETLRRARILEKLSETVLYSSGDTQQKALGQLYHYKGDFAARLKTVKQTTAAFDRISSREETDKRGAAREQKLAKERYQNILQAEEAELNIGRNVQQLNKSLVQQQAQQQTQWSRFIQTTPSPSQQSAPAPSNPFHQQQAPPPPPEVQGVPQPVAASPALEFPRKGEVFVFRQLQSTGDISFHYRSRVSLDFRNDLILTVVIFVLVGVVVLAGGFLLRTRKRKAVVLALIGIAALIIGVAVDIAIPALAGALLLYRGAPREKAPR
jgi:hypothetical protein